MEAAAVAHNSETKARIHGVWAQMKSFKFFGASLGETLRRHTDNLSRALQKKTSAAAEGQVLASMIKDTLTQLRTDECFDLANKACSLEIGEPELPRQAKRPRNNPEDEMIEDSSIVRSIRKRWIYSLHFWRIILINQDTGYIETSKFSCSKLITKKIVEKLLKLCVTFIKKIWTEISYIPSYKPLEPISIPVK